MRWSNDTPHAEQMQELFSVCGARRAKKRRRSVLAGLDGQLGRGMLADVAGYRVAQNRRRAGVGGRINRQDRAEK